MIGQTISHYKILGKLGEGGMGVVYKAEDTKLQRTVALKFLPIKLASAAQARQRFLNEARASSALNHPNICTIHAVEDAGEQPFIVMEFVEGQMLSEIIRGAPLAISHILAIASQIVEDLNQAHSKNITHRDLKPDNVMVTADGLVKVMDFGLAKMKDQSKLTKSDSTHGTAAYMSPEQAQAMEVDQRSDIFSFGAVLYEMTTGAADESDSPAELQSHKNSFLNFNDLTDDTERARHLQSAWHVSLIYLQAAKQQAR